MSHKASASPKEAILVARDMNSFALHIEVNGEVLCGTKNAMYGDHSTSHADVIESAPRQHAGWYWCSACASSLTGESRGWFAEQRQR